MIARHHKRGYSQGFDPVPGGLELSGAGTERQIACDHDKVRRLSLNRVAKALRKTVWHTAKMQVGCEGYLHTNTLFGTSNIGPFGSIENTIAPDLPSTTSLV